mmetsp:Transcript_178752/g.567214  ORF Transcript_178752/g.567214 Transcript_178752/m.567214 type:complete len:82 (-) Transcript_178752:112-357(-)
MERFNVLNILSKLLDADAVSSATFLHGQFDKSCPSTTAWRGSIDESEALEETSQKGCACDSLCIAEAAASWGRSSPDVRAH